jgi:hypothetical protein
MAVIAAAVLIAAPIANVRVTLGLGLGGALALMNYRWLQASVRDVLSAGETKTPPITYLKFIVRWLVIAGVGWLANRTGFFDATSIVAGLFAPAIAVGIEAGYTTVRTLLEGRG